MKTLAVLSALATIAFAAPTIEEYRDSTRLSPVDFTISQREKKSTPVETQKLPEHLEGHTLENGAGSSNLDARTFSGFKKPIVMKKKVGFHVYRDSGEEQTQAVSQENCKKQTKINLCDDNISKDKVKSASIDHHHDEISESEMEHSISIAKEAVHTFERDLQKMEHDCAENHNHRHTTLGSNTEIHEDIAKARQALEHIHKKFKNFDSVPTGDDSTSKVHLKSTNLDEERMIQWKEAGNLHKNVEIGKNLEDNFKSTFDKDESQITNFDANGSNNINKDFKTTIEDIDVPSRSNNKFEDGTTSIVEDKNGKTEIHSDNLVKSNINDDNHQKDQKQSRMEHHLMDEKKVTETHLDLHNHELVNHNKLKESERRNHAGNNEMLQSSDDESATHKLGRTKTEKELQTGHLHTKLSHEKDQLTHESSHVDTMSSSSNKKSSRSGELEVKHEGVTAENNKDKLHLLPDNFVHRTSLPKDTESMSNIQKHLRNDDTKRNIPQEIDLQRTTQHSLKSRDGISMDTQRSLPTMTVSKINNDKDSEKTHFKSDVDNQANNELVHLRATSDLHKDVLNNMDFVEDSHHHVLHHPALKEGSHMMKNGNQELHERFNIPGVHPNSEHLRTMMHFSDNSHHVNPQLKMSSMFNQQEPNMNVQFNSPQDFVEQTNVQEFMPFRATNDLHDNTGLDKRFKAIHDSADMPTELHDPLKVHRANLDHMRMDGSSQHFNIDTLTPPRSNMNDQHLSLNEQIRAQQAWAQAKSVHTHQLSPMTTGLERLHTQDTLQSRHNGHNMMMHEKSHVDSSIQPSSFTQMRGASKMALEHTVPNQWAHNHGAYRTSYGPGLSTSYGGGSSYGGSAVGVFPNANVGNCAVPILLSCSPSVVSGSLAKTQNAYSAPSYRSEDINFLKKRGVDIDDVTTRPKLHNALLGHRPNTVLEKSNNTV